MELKNVSRLRFDETGTYLPEHSKKQPLHAHSEARNAVIVETPLGGDLSYFGLFGKHVDGSVLNPEKLMMKPLDSITSDGIKYWRFYAIVPGSVLTKVLKQDTHVGFQLEAYSLEEETDFLGVLFVGSADEGEIVSAIEEYISENNITPEEDNYFRIIDTGSDWVYEQGEWTDTEERKARGIYQARHDVVQLSIKESYDSPPPTVKPDNTEIIINEMKTFLKKDGSRQLTDDWDVGGHDITGVATFIAEMIETNTIRAILGDVLFESDIDMDENDIKNVANVIADKIDAEIVDAETYRFKHDGDLTEVGDTRYNSDKRCLETLIDGGLIVRHSRHLHKKVRNTTGSSLARGTVCYISGSVAASPNVTVEKASKDNKEVAERSLLVLSQAINDGQDGIGAKAGEVEDISRSAILEGSDFAVGQRLWLSTDGKMTNQEPSAPDMRVQVGILSRLTPTQFAVMVTINAFPRVRQLSDVDGTYTEGDVMRKNGNDYFQPFNIDDAIDDLLPLDGSRAMTGDFDIDGNDIVSGTNFSVRVDTNQIIEFRGTKMKLHQLMNFNGQDIENIEEINGENFDDLVAELRALQGGIVYRGKLTDSTYTTEYINGDKSPLDDFIQAEEDRAPRMGDMVKDYEGGEWYFGESDWKYMGRVEIDLAAYALEEDVILRNGTQAMTDDFNVGGNKILNLTHIETPHYFTTVSDQGVGFVVDGVGYLSLENNEVLIPKDIRMDGGKIWNLRELHSDEPNIVMDDTGIDMGGNNIINAGNMYTAEQIDAILDDLKSIYGWSKSEVCVLTEGATVECGDLSEYDLIMLEVNLDQNDNDVWKSEWFRPEKPQIGDYIEVKVGSAPNDELIATLTRTDENLWTFTADPADGHTMTVIGLKMAPLDVSQIEGGNDWLNVDNQDEGRTDRLKLAIIDGKLSYQIEEGE